jgi:hypothetical protein
MFYALKKIKLKIKKKFKSLKKLKKEKKKEKRKEKMMDGWATPIADFGVAETPQIDWSRGGRTTPWLATPQGQREINKEKRERERERER